MLYIWVWICDFKGYISAEQLIEIVQFFVGLSSALKNKLIAHFLGFRLISSCKSLQYTLNTGFPAFLSLQGCSCHVPNENTHHHKVGRLCLSAAVGIRYKFPYKLTMWQCAKSPNLRGWATHCQIGTPHMHGCLIYLAWQPLETRKNHLWAQTLQFTSDVCTSCIYLLFE